MEEFDSSEKKIHPIDTRKTFILWKNLILPRRKYIQLTQEKHSFYGRI